MSTEAEQREAVVREALSWLGTPWVHHARAKGAGVDCGQLLAAVYERAGVVGYVPTPDYPQDWALHRSEPLFLNIVEGYAAPVAGDPQPGDIALFQFGRCLSHAGIVLAWPRIVHAYLNAHRVVIDDLGVAPDLAKRYRGCWSPWLKTVTTEECDGRL